MTIFTKKSTMINVAIFASGTGSNARKIIEYFNVNEKNSAKVKLVVSNRNEAGVLKIAKEFNISSLLLKRDSYLNTPTLIDDLSEHKIDFIVLAGFLWLIPDYLIKKFPKKIINIHPALLPKFGGKGMYGDNVHKAVKESGDLKSGITIHYVDENYDEGEIIFQATCELSNEDTSEMIASKVLKLEHQHFPVIIDSIISNQSKP